MDIDRTLRQLYEERKRLDGLIARLESRLKDAPTRPARSTRGRKSMGSDERQQVSARMTAYWAARRGRMHAGQSAAAEAQQEPAAHEFSA